MRDFFDDYVRRDFPGRRDSSGNSFVWPGDEWVDNRLRENIFSVLLDAPEIQDWRRIIEIGPGSGKYTEMILDRSHAHVTAFELSPALLESLKQRCARHLETGRLVVSDMAWTDNQALINAVGDNVGDIDVFFAIDVFLMMDFQSILIHLVSAARMLRVGGRLAATFGDADSDSGWRRMLMDTRRHSAFSLMPDTRFHWLSASFLETVLARLGFTVTVSVSGPDGGSVAPLDIARRYIVAELSDPRPTAALCRELWGA